ncbi:FAD synthase [Candidatus Lokiarchaeum ossiferum]|uniref:FAD synthase n=1 Tax=Candidatus Lokiarchaeum ossiferum TaxID=2951803 RepID=A0ABY6I056_9ARCH|nr:FAD synthase [Candidatus Lokiarchaeum sp. B-35]
MRVLITGCFDIIHPGHIFLLKEGAKLGEVYVIVARDSTIKKYKKKNPTIPEEQRLAVIQAIKYVTFAQLGNENNNFIRKALDLEPNIILLGPNQRIHIDSLEQMLQKNNASHIQVRRLEQFYTDYPLTSSSAIKKKIIDYN